MTDFYHPALEARQAVPAILGLTATPLMRFSEANLKSLEAVMDARCVTPKLHREQLLQYVKKPSLDIYSYTPAASYLTLAMKAVEDQFDELDITLDPTILHLRATPTDANLREANRLIKKRKTPTMMQMKGLCQRSSDIQKQLGVWAADYYLWKAITNALKRLRGEHHNLQHWMGEERRYLVDKLCKIEIPQPPDRPPSQDTLSDKVIQLLRVLLDAQPGTVGIVFVKERATTVILSTLLRSFPQIQKRFVVGSMVGTSNISSHQNFYDLTDENDGCMLERFRTGQVNLLIATSVLEEGIDIPACNFVVCFDLPATPKGFIQRRGRARKENSRLLVLVDNANDKLQQWEALEAEMSLIYQNEERDRARLQQLEDCAEISDESYKIATTGALLNYENAKAHLQHFCSALSRTDSLAGRPEYIIEEQSYTHLHAVVLLPSIVPQTLRKIEGKFTWRSEKMATKDVAFQAYVALHKAGLLNDNLLPHEKKDVAPLQERPSHARVQCLFDPWQHVARAWKTSTERWVYQVIWREGDVSGTYNLMMPIHIQRPETILLYVDSTTTATLTFTEGCAISLPEAELMRDDTHVLLALNFGHRWKLESEAHVIQLSAGDEALALEQIGNTPFDPHDIEVVSGNHLIRDNAGCPYVYVETLSEKPSIEKVQKPFYEYDEGPQSIPYLALNKWSRRSDFLHPALDGTDTTMPDPRYKFVQPASWVRVDSIHSRHARFGKLIPSIIHVLGTQMVAEHLRTTVLATLELPYSDLVRQAMFTSAAGEASDYERLEFLGDAILKYCATVQAASTHLDWPEGYLSFFKDGLVSNSRLWRASVQVGLDAYIMTKRFTGDRWRPLYVEKLCSESESPDAVRELSTKTLADVIESLIGVSFIAGGIEKALQCISMFLPECAWADVSDGRQKLLDAARQIDTDVPIVQGLEKLLQYSFQKKSLLIEATTHLSFKGDLENRSLERLEFLGDAVLDKVIVTKLFTVQPPLRNNQMHSLKTAMVNKDFLAFLILEEGDGVSEEPLLPAAAGLPEVNSTRGIWRYLRHASTTIGLDQAAARLRHRALRGEIWQALKTSDRFPWPLLARVHAPKFLSDLFESIFGAVWVDSGSLDACEAVLRHLGVMNVLERMLRDGVRMMHPKEEFAVLAKSEKVRYVVDCKPNLSGEPRYSCLLYLGQRLIVETADGMSKEEIECKSAALANHILEREADSAMDTSSDDDILYSSRS